MSNVGLTANVGVAAGALPFQLPSKRNIGLAIESQRGVPWTIYPDVGALSDYTKYFGGPYNGQYSYYLVKSIFDNTAPNNVPVTLKIFRAVGTGSNAATITDTIEGATITIFAGYQGQQDPGDWSNSLQVQFYSYGVNVFNAFVLQVLYNGKVVETWQGATCASLQQQINQSSQYITITFSAEIPVLTLSANLTGTITCNTGSTIVTGTATTFTTDLVVGSNIYDTGGNFIGVVKSIQTNTQLTLTGLAQHAETAANYKKRMDFSPLLNLAGGTYVTPEESDYYPVSDPSSPEGLAIFDGQDVQIIAVTENHTLSMATQEFEYCQNRADCIAVVNLPLNANEGLVVEYANALQTADRAFAAGYLEWIQVLDSTGAAVTIPELGVVLGAGFLTSPYVQGDFIHIPPAGTSGPFRNVQAVVTGLLSQALINAYVQQFNVNVSIVSKQYGRYLLSSRAYTTSTLWASIHTNLQISYYVRTLLDNLGFVTQKTNSPALKKQIIASLNNFFQGEYDNGSLEQAVSYEENVAIICDQSNNPLSQDRKILNIEVDYIPPEAVESVIININRNDAVLTATVTTSSTQTS